MINRSLFGKAIHLMGMKFGFFIFRMKLHMISNKDLAHKEHRESDIKMENLMGICNIGFRILVKTKIYFQLMENK